MPMAWSTAATSAATGRASGKFATAPRPSAISFSPACLSIVRHRVGHVADRGDAAGDRGPRAGPEVVHPDREPEPVARPLVHQVRVRVDPAGNREQAAGGELLRPRHRAAELGDPAAGYADV